MPATATDVPASERTGPDRCPGILRPHRAQDGLLVRVRLIGGRLDAPALRALAHAGRAGNGIVELTSRANVQVRGLREDALGAVADRLAGAGLLRSATHERARNVIADPLAGPAVDALLDALDDRLCADAELAALPGRFQFCVGDVAGVDADLRVLDDGVVAGGRFVTSDDPVGAALNVARAFLRERDERTWRIAELPSPLVDGVPWTPPAERPPLVGADAARGVVGALAPLGRLSLEALGVLADLGGTRVSHRRTLTVRGAHDAAARLGEAGLVLDPDSGWHGLTACAGAGACASALADVRAEAARRASERGRGAPREHWSACGRRCGETPGVERAVVARPDGGFEVTA